MQDGKAGLCLSYISNLALSKCYVEQICHLHNTRYKWVVSDGDSKAFNAVENIHGDECKVEKVDCV